MPEGLLLAGPGSANSAVRSTPDGQPNLQQPIQANYNYFLAATSMDKDRPIQHGGAQDRQAAGALNRRVLDQALAGLDDGELADSLQGDEVFAWAR